MVALLARFRGECCVFRPSAALWVACLGLLAALQTRPADAESDPNEKLRLSYENRSGVICPDGAWLANAVASRLGYSPFSPQASDAIVVVITRAATGLRGEVRWAGAARRASDVRVLSLPNSDCDELARVLALTISVAIDPLRAGPSLASPTPSPDATGAPTPAAPTPPPPPAVASTPETTATAPGASPSDVRPPPDPVPLVAPKPTEIRPPDEPGPSAPPREPSAAVTHVWFGSHATSGLSPQLSVGAEAGVGIAFEHASLGIALRADLPTSKAFEGGQVSVSSALATASFCGREWALEACALGRFGWLVGQGSAFVKTGSGLSPIATAGARLALYPLEGKTLRLRLHIDADTLLTTNSFDVDGISAWSPPALAETVGLAILMAFP